jgi:hypothetical protein
MDEQYPGQKPTVTADTLDKTSTVAGAVAKWADKKQADYQMARDARAAAAPQPNS